MTLILAGIESLRQTRGETRRLTDLGSERHRPRVQRL